MICWFHLFYKECTLFIYDLQVAVRVTYSHTHIVHGNTQCTITQHITVVKDLSSLEYIALAVFINTLVILLLHVLLTFISLTCRVFCIMLYARLFYLQAEYGVASSSFGYCL